MSPGAGPAGQPGSPPPSGRCPRSCPALVARFSLSGALRGAVTAAAVIAHLTRQSGDAFAIGGTESEPPVEGTTRKRRFSAGREARSWHRGPRPGSVGARGGSGKGAAGLTGASRGGGPGQCGGRTGPGGGFVPPEGPSRAVLCPGRGEIPGFAAQNELGAATGAASPAPASHGSGPRPPRPRRGAASPGFRLPAPRSRHPPAVPNREGAAGGDVPGGGAD